MTESLVVSQLLNEYSNISAAKALAGRRIDQARAALGSSQEEGLDVVAFGSLARQEVTRESDFDYLVLATNLPEDLETAANLLTKANELRRSWFIEEGMTEKEVPGPGASGVFGRAVGAFDLIDQIGLQQDTNHSLTRRMLLLEESVSLMNQDVYDSVIQTTLRRYLTVGSTRPDKVPRFLLNDVVRYWRTISVDYQAKAREGIDSSGLRYLKLIIPRKVLFAGTAMSLLLCGREGFHTAEVPDLQDQVRMPPIDRLVQGYPVAPPPVQDAMREVLSVLDTYLGCSGNPEWRSLVKQGRRGADANPPEFLAMCDAGDRLQQGLEVVFFDWDVVAARSRQMLAF
ncbi:nucleotidyltransferase domain-containing protein [Ornithinimicrobium pratense]|nr:nucleotidyltransferase domain-containing protein [Ornithinimicrobium pratense]